MLPEVLELFAVGIAVYDAGGALVCANRAAKRHLDDPLVARTISAAQARDGAGAVAANETLQVCSVATGSLVVAIVSRAGHTSIAAAARLYELTPTEERIAALLADGGTARQIATRLGVSLHTVQSHLKSIFGKTETSSQNELIARLRGGIALLALKEFFLVAPAIKGCANHPDSLPSATRVQKQSKRAVMKTRHAFAVCFLVFCTSLFAQPATPPGQGGPPPDASPLSILTAKADPAMITLHFEGLNICAAPIVKMDAKPLPLAPGSTPTATAFDVVRPPGIQAGTYLTQVRCGSASNQVAPIDLTLGIWRVG